MGTLRLDETLMELYADDDDCKKVWATCEFK